MQKKPVTIIARTEHLPDYGFLSARGEQVILQALEGTAEPAINYDSDLVILDCRADGTTGLLLINKFKQSVPRVPIIFITGTFSGHIAIQAFKAGARECFQHPVDLSELKVTVENILCLKRETIRPRRSISMIEKEEKSRKPHLDDLPERIMRATQFIEQNLTKLVYLNDVSHEACLSKFHFCRVFKQYVGMTPLQYLAFLRIEKAKQLLQESEASIALVAIRVGINDPSNFIKLFKNNTGMTPSSYRNLQTT